MCSQKIKIWQTSESPIPLFFNHPVYHEINICITLSFTPPKFNLCFHILTQIWQIYCKFVRLWLGIPALYVFLYNFELKYAVIIPANFSNMCSDNRQILLCCTFHNIFVVFAQLQSSYVHFSFWLALYIHWYCELCVVCCHLSLSKLLNKRLTTGFCCLVL